MIRVKGTKGQCLELCWPLSQDRYFTDSRPVCVLPGFFAYTPPVPAQPSVWLITQQPAMSCWLPVWHCLSYFCSAFSGQQKPLFNIKASLYAPLGVVSENESMVTPVFATPILTTSWLAWIYPASEWDFIPAPWWVPRLMNLQKIYGFNEPFRFTGSSTGRWAVSIINISIRKTRWMIV